MQTTALITGYARTSLATSLAQRWHGTQVLGNTLLFFLHLLLFAKRTEQYRLSRPVPLLCGKGS